MRQKGGCGFYLKPLRINNRNRSGSIQERPSAGAFERKLASQPNVALYFDRTWAITNNPPLTMLPLLLQNK